MKQFHLGIHRVFSALYKVWDNNEKNGKPKVVNYLDTLKSVMKIIHLPVSETPYFIIFETKLTITLIVTVSSKKRNDTAP